MADTKKYWKGIEELEQAPEFVESSKKEFSEYVPVDEFIGNASEDSSATNRRDFLKVLGFSVTAATLAACEAPVTKSIPFLNKPEDLTPGVANYYSSTFFDGLDLASIRIKTREGRLILIEGQFAWKSCKINAISQHLLLQSATIECHLEDLFILVLR